MRALPAAPLLVLCACSPGPGRFVQRPATPIGWPATDPQARVELLFVYHDTHDVERKRGLFGRLGDLLAGKEVRRLVSPYGCALTPAGDLLVADTAQALVHRLSLESGEHRLHTGDGDTQLVTPIAVALAPDGRFFVTDSTSSQVVIFSPQGEPLGAFGSAAETGRPTGIAYDPVGRRMLVVDTTGGRILSYDLDGHLLEARGERGGGPGQFNYPTNVAVDAAGRSYVVDTLNFRVQILSGDFEPLGEIGTLGTGPGTFAKPKGVALDSDGHVYVVDGMFDNVQIFDPDGTLLLTFGATGSGFGNLSLPTGILIDERDRIFVSDGGNARIQVFQYHPRATP